MIKTRRIPSDTRTRPKLPVRQFSISEYHRLVEVGILTPNDRVELINGWIVPKVPQNEPHASVIEWLNLWLAKYLDDERYSLRCQLPLTLKGDCEPEPDLAVVKSAKQRERNQHPMGNDTFLVIEVSDASLSQDRNEKLEMYAANRIPEYWIINLVDRQIEVHTDPISGKRPAYHSRSLYLPSDHVPFTLGNAPKGLPVSKALGTIGN
jgi:Uma2 family endonuclease